MVTRWNQIATYLSGAICAAIVTLGGCSGGGGGSSSLPAQPSEQNPASPTQTSPPSQATPPSTTSSVRIYATAKNTVNVYDEEGHQFANCPFPNLMNPFDIAFDSSNQRLYVTGAAFGAGGVFAFDLNGNPIKTQGAFPGAGFIITADSNNHHIYTFTAGEPPAAVFDEEGNPVQVSGSFAAAATPFAAAFDPFNHQIYVTSIIGASVTVFDEQGNGIKFPLIDQCGGGKAIAFDSHNRHFYMSGDETAGCGNHTVTVFDEAGNLVTTTGTFPGVSSPTGITFDAHNNRLYVENPGGPINVYDEEGNQITPSGTFPNAVGGSLVAAPQ